MAGSVTGGRRVAAIGFLKEGSVHNSRRATPISRGTLQSKGAYSTIQHPFVIQNMTLRDKFSIGESDEKNLRKSVEKQEEQFDATRLFSVNSTTSNAQLYIID